MSSLFSSRERQDLLGKRILVVVGVATFFLLTIKIVLDLQKPELIENLCPKTGPTKEFVVLVDRTDPFTDTQRKFVNEWILSLGEKLQRYERLSVYGLSADESTWNAEPYFSQCSPGNQANELYQTKSKVKAAYKEHFEKPLRTTLATVMTNGTSSMSPIMEMIESISQRPELTGHVPARDFIIVSDMMQNSGSYSHYKTPADYLGFTRSASFKAKSLNLDKVTVSLLYLERQELQKYQTPTHVEFWERWFDENGVRVKEVIRIR